jgi:2-keto-4-pentenoate hydratase/2-oxohepta-3-ene-1,7-dioic acid hydratase in catechol pathway
MGIEPNYDIADPMVFVVPSSAVVGPDAQIVRPSDHPDQVDYEGEVAVVVGRSGRDISPVDAWAHIAGVTAVNDVTARDVQLVAMVGADPGIGDSKSYPTFKPLGPALLTVDELDPSFDLGLTTTVNGEVRQDARTTEFLTPIDELLAFISRTHGLEVGDVICTGSPRGVGMWSGPTWLAPGDVVEVAVEGVGALRSIVS